MTITEQNNEREALDRQVNRWTQQRDRLNDLIAHANGTAPATLTDYSYQQLYDAIAAATRVTSGTAHIAISVIDFRAALVAA